MKTQTHVRPSLAIGNPSSFLREQIHEDSNHELDWLWAAGQVTDVEEIRYCLERALYINPNSGDTRRALANLAQKQAIANRVRASNTQSRVQPSGS